MDLIVITGQTATGKTKLALEYAKKYNGELVNFDSRQVYKHLDIITGKDLPVRTNANDKKRSVWLYDIITPDQYFSSFEYLKYAEKTIKEISKRGKIPILVGGSYFYLKHLLYGFDFKAPPDFKLRDKLNLKTVKELQKIINKLNPNIQSLMNQSDWNNPRRLIRKIEIETYKKNNNKESTETIKKQNKYKVINYIGLYYKDKEKLKNIITDRVEKRLRNGAIDEVKKLLEKEYKKTDPGLKTIGYKQIIEYIEEKVSKEKAIENWITAEIQYAKRQHDFMKKDENISWRAI